MKRKHLAISLCLLTSVATLSACGSKKASVDTTAAASAETTVATAETTAAATADTAAKTADTTAAKAADTTAAAAAAAGDVKCPTNLVIQTDWWPEVEHGGSYQLIGAGGTVDSKLFTYKGKIQDKYKVGGIETVEVRAGGDAIQFSPVSTVMKTDTNVYLGYVNTDDAISTSDKVQVTAVANTLDINPQMIMWDPAQTTIDKKDPTTFKSSGKSVLHFPGTTYIDWMVSKGYLDAKQSDPNYGGAPDVWIGKGGDYIQQGFATNEIYKYTNDIKWKNGAAAPVDYALIDSLGWRPYPAAYSIMTDRLEAEKGCLTALVPKLQQAWVDFVADPKATSDQIIAVSEGYNNYWKLTPGLNENALKLFKSDGIAGNGPDATYGNFDDARIKALYDELVPILATKNTKLPDGFKPENVYTNQFIDKSIGVK
jgi:hypothetical protein